MNLNRFLDNPIWIKTTQWEGKSMGEAILQKLEGTTDETSRKTVTAAFSFYG